ncbi:integrase arm-type DNA-binding domain-containing protein [Aestuariivirga sp.]|uniref:integrase arm-type DNA-binding domain-containing protein n=1 Tax=Aestuariivirga sp. TaxID=2650926 RepID=UPI003593D0F3
MVQITDMKARNIAPGHAVSDGTVPGLKLEAGKLKGHGKWMLRFVSPVTGKRRDMGLGAYPEVTIAEARAKALAARSLLKAKRDPLEERQAAASVQAAAMTFEQAARKVHEEQKPGWKNAKHADQWITTLERHAFPVIGKLKVGDLGDVPYSVENAKAGVAG